MTAIFKKAKPLLAKHKDDKDIKELIEKLKSKLQNDNYDINDKAWLTMLFCKKIIELKEF